MEEQMLQHIAQGNQFLKNGDFARAEDQFRKLLRLDPNNADAYKGLLMASMRAKSDQDLGTATRAVDRDPYYKKAYEYANDSQRLLLEECAARSRQNAAEIRYERAMDLLEGASAAKDYADAAYWFSAALKYVPNYRDAAIRMRTCKNRYNRMTAPIEKYDVLSDLDELEGTVEPKKDVYDTFVEQNEKLKEEARQKQEAENDAFKAVAEKGKGILNKVIQQNKDTGNAGGQNTAAGGNTSSDSNQLTKEEKKGCIGCLAIILGIVAVLVFIFVGIPQIRFNNAVKMMENGDTSWVELIGKLEKQDQMMEKVEDRVSVLEDEGRAKEALELMLTAKQIDGLYWRECDAFAQKYGQKAYEDGDYETAWEFYKQMSELPFGDEAFESTNYMLGLKRMDTALFGSDPQPFKEAVDHFNNCPNYYNVMDVMQDCMYHYVQLSPYREDENTVSYLQQLKNWEYPKIDELYDQVFAWGIETLGVNSNPDDSDTNLAQIGINEPVYFHFRITGGPPNGMLLMHTKYYKPNGSSGDYVFRNEWESGSVLWYGWTDSIYAESGSPAPGTMRVEFYDPNGRMLGEMQVEIVE